MNPDRLVSSDPPLSFVYGWWRESQVGLPVDHHNLQTLPFVIPATGASYTTRLYYTPRIVYPSASLLSLSASTLTTSASSTPLPSLITSLLPRSGTSLHGEQSADQPSLYEDFPKRRRMNQAKFLFGSHQLLEEFPL